MTTNLTSRAKISAASRRFAFTLIEMTIVIMVITILAALALPVVNSAYQQSRAHRTRAIIAKIDQIIGEKYESYRTRQVPIRVSPGMTPQNAAILRVNAIRELMRVELPDRITDVASGPRFTLTIPLPVHDVVPSPGGIYPIRPFVILPARPALNKQILRRADEIGGLENWNTQNESSECLYFILAATRDGDKHALDWFAPSEIGDTDGDGMKEILDSWGNPIAFLRWAPGYRADVAPYPVTPQRRNETGVATDETTLPDPFDPFKIDYRWQDADLTNDPIALKPLIWSAGPDKRHGISVNTPTVAGVPQPYATSNPPNDPYWPQAVMVGAPFNSDATDNITNHDLEAR